MRHFIAGLAIVTFFAGVALADEPAMLNDPQNAWDNFKKVVSMAEPSGDAIWDVHHGKEFQAGSSIRLYTAEKWAIPVVKDLDVRLGWFNAPGIYGTLSLALDRATGNPILRFVHVGWMVGASFDKGRDTVVTGPVVGVKGSF